MGRGSGWWVLVAVLLVGYLAGAYAPPRLVLLALASLLGGLVIGWVVGWVVVAFVKGRGQ